MMSWRPRGRRQRLVRRRPLGTAEEAATFETLHAASLMAPLLRRGFDPAHAAQALTHVRTLLGTPTVAILDASGPLAWDGPERTDDVDRLVADVLSSGTTQASRSAVVAPLAVDNRVVGALLAAGDEASAALVRATSEVATWMSSQLELADLEESHFIYNCLAAIASFVRTDPERARELLLEFAEYTRYSFREHGQFTTLAEELRSIERYLVLEKARFGDRLRVVMRISPEVLSLRLPFLTVQPLVENAVRHGLESKPGTGTVTVVALDEGPDCVITVEDDGVGSEPDTVRAALAGSNASPSVGLGNVDERMRTTYGDDRGIVVETGPGLGTRVTLRVPKFAPD